MDINGSVALVAGGASGLGAATARMLAARGAKVACLDRHAEAAAATAEPLGGIGLAADVSDAAAVEAAVDRLVDSLGAPRILVNCAGIADAGRMISREGQLNLDLFSRVVQVNLIGSYVVMSYAVRAMSTLEPLAEGERGVVINTASIAYQDGQIGQAAYAASKGGVSSMTLPLARELAGQGIRCMAIAPGLFLTPMMAGLPQPVQESLAQLPPFPKRLGEPDEFAALACHIIENRMFNGETVRLDGGVRMPAR